MKKTQANIHDVLGAFVNENNYEEFLNWLYPMLNQKTKNAVKEFWKEEGALLTPEVFNSICDVAKNVTGVDVRSDKRRTKEISFAQFLICYALYYEFVARKKATLQEICSLYMTNLKHSQILYGVNAIEKRVNDSSVSELLLKFANELAEKQFVRSYQRLVVLKANNANAQIQNETQPS